MDVSFRGGSFADAPISTKMLNMASTRTFSAIFFLVERFDVKSFQRSKIQFILTLSYTITKSRHFQIFDFFGYILGIMNYSGELESSEDSNFGVKGTILYGFQNKTKIMENICDRAK